MSSSIRGEGSKVLHLNDEVNYLHTESVKPNGKRAVLFEPTLILSFLKKEGFRSYKDEIVRLVNSKVRVVERRDVFKYLFNHIKTFNDDVLENEFFKQVEKLLLKNNGLIHVISEIEKRPLQDNVGEGFIAYENGILKVSKNNLELIEYSDIDYFVWEEQILKRNFKFIEEYDRSPNVYDLCLRNSTNNKKHYLSVVSSIGNLIHKYKDQRLTKAIIINDENLDEKSEEGGSGKGLIVKAVSKIRSTLIINGKNADPAKNRFFLQGVNLRTCVISIDDPPRNVVFEDYFSFLTDEMTVEKKHKSSIVIPFKESPKFSFTTNYSIKGKSSSHKRRRFDIFLNNYYSSEYRPTDEFGHEFFYDWDEFEWSKFDYFMSRCLQTFLKNGLIEYENHELNLKKFKNETSSDFFDLMENEYCNEQTNSLPDLRAKLIHTYGEKYMFLKNDTSRLMRWVEEYCEFKGFSLQKSRNSSGMCFKIKNKK